MHMGRAIAQGTPQEVRDNEEVARAFLGEDAAPIASPEPQGRTEARHA
jgi:hypothetical protein